MDYETNRIITQEELNKMGEELSNYAESQINQQFSKISNDMDYEKKYKDALEQAKKELRTCGSMDCDAAKQIFRFFPELKENEDEKVRKEIINYFAKGKEYLSLCSIGKDDILAWLEKQKPIQNINKEDEEVRQYIVRIMKQRDIKVPMVQKALTWLEKQGEQKPTIKYVYPKFRIGDVIVPIKPNGSFVPVRVKAISDGSYYCAADKNNAFLSLPIREENEYRLAEQKPTEWSGKDEVMIKVFDSIIRYIVEVVDKNVLERFGTNREELFSWLKSLRPNHWKPSDEQMKQLGWIAEQNKDNMIGKELISLYQDLKKLREE